MTDSYLGAIRKLAKTLGLGKIKRLIVHFKSYLNLWVYPGHYYSPLPDQQQALSYRRQLSNDPHTPVPGIHLNSANQLKLLKKFKAYAQEMKFPATKQQTFRYYYENEMFAYSDAMSLFGILKEFSPKRIIEVGSGFSSALMLDFRQQFKVQMSITCIEPYPERLMAQLRKDDLGSDFQLIRSTVQEVDAATFSSLQDGDILFIDSSHVSKIGSDVNFLFFSVLSQLKAGVIVHIHDVKWPFEYDLAAVKEGRAWNEAYLTRAFLQHNDSFEVLYWSSYLTEAYPAEASQITQYNHAKFGTGGSIWLRKKA